MAFTIQFKRQISALQDYTLRTHLVLELNDRITVPINFIIFDKTLECRVRADDEQRCSTSGPHKMIDFQNLALNEQKEKRLYITNNNPSSIDLTLPPTMEDGAEDVNQVRVVLEDLLSGSGVVDKRTSFKQTTKKRIVVRLQPMQTAVLAFILNAK